MPETNALELGTELAELCRHHAIERDWIERSQSLDDLLDRVLEACASDLQQAHEFERQRDLVAFVRRAVVLRAQLNAAPQFVSRVEDLERLRSPERSTSVERMIELLGDISALCHRINNPLTSLLGRAQILQLKKDADPQQLVRTAQVIEESSRRIAELIQELGQLVCRGREELLTRRTG